MALASTNSIYTRRRARRAIPNVTPIGCSQSVNRSLPVAVRRIVESLHPTQVILFGSYAYGTPTPDSDVDLLVVMPTRAKNSERSWKVSRLLIPRPFPVDILVKTPQEISAALNAGDFFIREIFTRGQVLYEQR